MVDERLEQLANIKYQQPEVAWLQRKEEIHQKLLEVIEVFKKHTDDQAFITMLKKMEEKFND